VKGKHRPGHLTAIPACTHDVTFFPALLTTGNTSILSSSPTMETMAPHQTGFGSPIPPIFHWPVYFCTGLTTVCYVLSIITGNVSQASLLVSSYGLI
jgi:hypothetical protein